MSSDSIEETASTDANRVTQDANGYIYAFGDFELHTRTFELFRSGRATGLQLKPTKLLIFLIEHRERTVPKEELIKAIWPDTYVTESAFTTAMRHIRQALNDDDDSVFFVIQSRHQRVLEPADHLLALVIRHHLIRFVGVINNNHITATTGETTADRRRYPTTHLGGSIFRLRISHLVGAGCWK